MSLTQQVAALVIAAGSATADDLLPQMPGATRPQVLRALKAALDRGLIETEGWTGPRHGGSKPATYRAIRPKSRPAGSVWEFAARASA